MSNRGHIWNKTIPLLGKHAFMGSGANTYMFEVPQEDYISQNYVYGANSYDVKAHCWYLQQWVETGLTRYPGTSGISVLVSGTVDTHLPQSGSAREYQLGWIWIICGSAGVHDCRYCKRFQCMYRSGILGYAWPGTCSEPYARKERKSLCC